MQHALMVAGILGASFVAFLLLMFFIRYFGIKNQYWDYKFGVSREWDFGQLGDVTLIYQVNPEDISELELVLELHQANGCTQRSYTHFERNEQNERHVFGLLRDADIKEIEEEVAFLIDKSINGFRDLGIRPRPKLVSARG